MTEKRLIDTGTFFAEVPARPVVRYSARQHSWYIESAGECVSGLYDTEREAAAALESGEY